MPLEQDDYFRNTLMVASSHGDGDVLSVATAMLLAVLTGRSDLCIAGVFGAGTTRSLAVLLIAIQSVLPHFTELSSQRRMLLPKH